MMSLPQLLVQGTDLNRTTYDLSYAFKIQRESLSGFYFDYYAILHAEDGKPYLFSVGKDNVFSVGVKPATLLTKLKDVLPGEAFTYSRKTYTRLTQEEVSRLLSYSVYVHKGARSI
jgi:hypothetical protein